VQRLDDRGGLADGARYSHHADARLGLEQAAERRADGRMIVDDEHGGDVARA
jgi:hypothetical protein